MRKKRSVSGYTVKEKKARMTRKTKGLWGRGENHDCEKVLGTLKALLKGRVRRGGAKSRKEEVGGRGWEGKRGGGTGACIMNTPK